MTNEQVKQWTDALRSGEYKQGKGALCNVNGFCCLGVLCDLHGLSYKKFSAINTLTYFHKSKSKASIDFLPLDFANELSLNNRGNPTDFLKTYNLGLAPHLTGRSLSELNDEEGVTFEEIADVIEAWHKAGLLSHEMPIGPTQT